MQILKIKESVEFFCYTPQSGTFYGEKRLKKKLEIKYDGTIKIIDMEPNKNNIVENPIIYNITDLIQVVYRRESNSSDIKDITLIVDPFKLENKNRQEIYH